MVNIVDIKMDNLEDGARTTGVARIYKAAIGDKVQKGDILFSVGPYFGDDDQRSSAIYAPDSGTITELLIKDGAWVSAGMLLARMTVDG